MAGVRVRVIHDIDDLANDCVAVSRKVKPAAERLIRKRLRIGNDLAKANARRTAGSHGKHYHKAFTVEMHGALSGEYGPDSAMPQGGMSFEFGSRNSPPHRDLARSNDVNAPGFYDDAGDMTEDWFW